MSVQGENSTVAGNIVERDGAVFLRLWSQGWGKSVEITASGRRRRILYARLSEQAADEERVREVVQVPEGFAQLAFVIAHMPADADWAENGSLRLEGAVEILSGLLNEHPCAEDVRNLLRAR